MNTNPDPDQPKESLPRRHVVRFFIFIVVVMGAGAFILRDEFIAREVPQRNTASKTTPRDTHTAENVPPPRPPRPDPVLAREGEQIYNAFCVACHQPEAAGLVGLAPSIRNRDFLAIAGDEFIRNTIRMGRPGTAMVSWAHLSDRQIDGLLAYLHTARAYRPVTVRVDPARKYSGNPDNGKLTYQTYCAACHGAEGSGYAAGGSGPGIGLAGFLTVASDDYIFQTVKHGRLGTPMKSFIGPAGLANLTEGQVGDVIAYLRTLKGKADIATAKTGEEHFNINCIACHQPGGIGNPGFAPSIRNHDFLALASDDFIRQTVRSGRPGTAMLGRPDLSDEAVTGIIAYLRSLPGPKRKIIEVDPDRKYAGDATAGHEKFAIYCAACHGARGTGYAAGGAGPAIGLSGFLAAASDDYIFQTVKQGRVGTAMRPFMGPTGLANLSTGDVSDIISYLRTLN